MSMTSERAVVLVSGGMDSATATKEYECAQALADRLGVADLLHIETDHLARIGASSLTDENIAVEEADVESDEIPTSYVPFRNANLLAMATSYAEANDCSAVFIGAHSEDYSGYPDCRPEFFEAFQPVIDVGTKPETKISLKAPFVKWSKTEIAQRGVDLNVPYDLTWSCYRDEAPACGTCDACVFRLKAFQSIDIEDPITYTERPTYTT